MIPTLVILQVDIVQEYRDTQTEINQLTDVQLPTLELADIMSLVICILQLTI